MVDLDDEARIEDARQALSEAEAAAAEDARLIAASRAVSARLRATRQTDHLVDHLRQLITGGAA